MRRKSAFHHWLRCKKGLSPRAANDIGSRERRALRMIDDTDTGTAPVTELLDRLTSTSDYNACNATIRSQMKRALTLRAEWESERE